MWLTTLFSSRTRFPGGSASLGEGGGAYFAAGGVVCLDRLTSISGNTASTGDNDVFGSCTPC